MQARTSDDLAMFEEFCNTMANNLNIITKVSLVSGGSIAIVTLCNEGHAKGEGSTLCCAFVNNCLTTQIVLSYLPGKA